MLRQDISGRIGIVIAVIVWLIMTASAVWAGVGGYDAGPDSGFAQPLWEMKYCPPWVSLLGNMALVGLMTFFMIMLNRHYNFIPDTTLTFAASFLIFMGADTQASTQLHATTILAAVNLACVGMLYSQRKGQNASAVLFIIASTLSAASLCNVAQAFFIPVYMACAMAMGLFGLREFVAAMMGIVAPWICILCLGVSSIASLHEPSIIPIWDASPPLGDELVPTVLVIAVSLTGAVGVLRNLYSLNAANRAVREMFRCTSIPVAGILIMLVLDWGHYQLYYGPMALFAAFQLGYITAFLPRRNRDVPFWCMLGAGTGLFVLMLLYS